MTQIFSTEGAGPTQGSTRSPRRPKNIDNVANIDRTTNIDISKSRSATIPLKLDVPNCTQRFVDPIEKVKEGSVISNWSTYVFLISFESLLDLRDSRHLIFFPELIYPKRKVEGRRVFWEQKLTWPGQPNLTPLLHVL